ncbi:probable 28S ribosomal protein S26, mitochondrial [Drosophila guanche]|uniref:Small ribosomal subunit protein mS26 n=1 Tax=Drosophila guanche TaxID=7266 RepID=A0A3B0JUK2_DROGU|nr:probable 28S ribosomal protein S26, mitochondrial [Drosophila guanche]SPP77036.1 blast:Probable 28S ribosomal protein S26%2C mitochondrial [Drosophila guanche]
MLRAGCQLLTQSTLPAAKTGSNGFALEFVRWRRKPRWLPVAKSKMFRVPERKKQTEEERTELMRLHNQYKTQLRSVRQFLREEVVRHEETSTADHIVLTPEQEEAEYQALLAANAEWNATIARERDQRLAKERDEKVAYVQERLEALKLRDEERRERANEAVLREIERSKTYITREGLTAAIETALANPVDPNFAIDMSGNLYQGRTSLELPNAAPEPDQQALSN